MHEIIRNGFIQWQLVVVATVEPKKNRHLRIMAF